MSKLSEFNFIVAIDTSGSMGEPVKPVDRVDAFDSTAELILNALVD